LGLLSTTHIFCEYLEGDMKNANQQRQAANETTAMRLGEAAMRVDCSRRFLEHQIKAGRLSVIRLSPRCVRIRPSDLAEYLERNAVTV
jgi:excisionase family DNA binding protein